MALRILRSFIFNLEKINEDDQCNNDLIDRRPLIINMAPLPAQLK